MEVKAKVSLDFVLYPVSKKLTVGQNIVTLLAAAGSLFPNLPLTVDTLLQTTTTLSDAEQAAMSGDKIAMGKRNVANALWNNQFRTTANYISLVAEGNIEMIKSTGFEPTKTTRQKKAKVAGLVNFKARVENEKGKASVSFKRAKSAKGYVFIAAPEVVKIMKAGEDMLLDINGVQVRIKTGTQSSVTFSGLQSDLRVNLSAFAFNASGSSPVTELQSVLPQ